MKFLSSMYLHTVCQIIIKKPKKNANFYYYGSDFWIERIHAAKCSRKRLVFRDFNYRKLVFMENKYDIRDQHAKIHQKLYFLSRNISMKIFPLLPLSFLFRKFLPVPPYRQNFHAKFFMVKNNFFGVFLHADSEYDTYFP